MTVDVASLVFEIDSTQAKRAAADLDMVTAAGDRLDVSARKVQTATQLAGIGMQSTNDATVKATKTATDLAGAQGAVEKATKGSAAASAETRAQRQLEAAAMAELVKATKDYERDQVAAAKAVAAAEKAAAAEQAAAAKAASAAEAKAAAESAAAQKARSTAIQDARRLDAAAMAELVAADKAYEASLAAVAREEAAAATSKARLATQVDNILGRLDPLVKIQNVAAASTAKLDQALAAGVITAEQHAVATAQVVAAAEKGAVGFTHLASGAKLSGAQLQEFEGIARHSFDALASGANPFVVLTQHAASFAQAMGQGGGVAGVLNALLSPIALVVAGVAALAVGVGVLVFGMFKGEEEMRKFNGSLVATGNYAGLTAGSLQSMSEQISKASDTTIGSSKKTVESLTETGKFSGAAIASLAGSVQNYSRITGESADKFAKEYMGMGDHLVQFAVKHEDVYHDLTVQQLDQIALLVKHGQEQKAQDLLAADIFAASKHRLEEATNDEAAHFGWLQKLMHETALVASKMWDGILGLGRTKTIDEQIKDAQSRVAADAGTNFKPGTMMGNAVQTNATRLAMLQGIKSMQDQGVAAQAAKAATDHNAIQAKYGDGKAHGRTPTDNNATALDTAQKAELAAQLSLTADIEQVAAIKRDEVAAELKLQQDRIAKQVREKTITASTATLADAAYKAAADAKDELINRQEAAALIERELTQRRALGSDLDAIASIQASMAGTATQANAIESKALADRQQLEHDVLAAQTNQDVISKKITDVQQVQLLVSNDNLHVAQREQQARQAQIKVIEETAALQVSELDRQKSVLQADASLLTSTFARAVAEKNILAITQQEELVQAQRAIDVTKLGSAARAEAENAMASVKARQAADKKLLDRETSLLNGIKDATGAATDLRDALSRHDWASVFDDFQRTIQSVQASFAAHGLSGGLTAGGSVLATLVGGPTGNAIGTGLGIAGLGASLGGLVSGFAASSAGAAFAAGAAGANAVGMSLLGSFASTIAPLLGPIGIIAGIGVALASLLKSKPSNNGAIATLTGTTSFATGGDKATSETTQAATSAANAVLQGEQLLQAAGIKLATTVSKIDIGTRDLTHVFLSTGEEIRTAIGDPAAAAEAGLKAVLQGATYTSDAEKKLVESLIAAGKGFDDIATALQTYAAAQQVSAALADQILQLQDPKAYDLKAVHDAIDAQKASATAMKTAGDLTADQLDTINGQLDVLEGLQLDAVMKKYASAVDDATKAAQGAVDQAQSGVDAARQTLTDAYNAQSTALQANIDNLRQAATSLAAFRDSLTTGASAMNDPTRQLAITRAAFAKLEALPAGDATRLAGLQSAGEAFLAASKAAAPTQAAYNRDLAEVRRATDVSATAATQGADLAQQQLDALNASVAGLIDINGSVQAGATTVSGAIAALTTAIQALATAQAAQTALATQLATQTPTPAVAGPVTAPATATNDNAAAANANTPLPGAVETAIQAAIQASLGGGGSRLGEFGQEQQFATGGAFTVQGPTAGDHVPVDFMANGGEQVSISKADSMAELAEAMADLKAEVAALRAAAESTARTNASMDSREAKRDIRGLYVRGEQPNDPVSTKEAA